MSAESPGARERIGHWRQSFRLWRWRRPFWAGLLTLLGGVPIIWIPYADPSLSQLSFRLATTTGSGSLIIGVLLFVLGLTLWFQPHSRVFSGVAAILLALVSLVVSNLGGLFVGFLLAMVGGAMGVSWVQIKERPADPAETGGASGGPAPEEAPREVDLAIVEPASAGVDDGQNGARRDA
ncbi:DUF6114 domain-containing protein [Streptomyces sp. CNQ085]|uniref:DUF6114 domain-containing protein n=1 Tax=Streptomyces sp. CNQ085 TaxID=2886944 RepID=UPI001F50E7A1|nr:DUF6114 domain-containing protein [Streptomyces sp. CNQ085]MCI0384950.1 DUF6114 domain-containing protein [Streptomyces sp. CNQ085]